MKKFLRGRVRDTEKMTVIVGRAGNPSDYWSIFSIMLRDPQDGEFFHHHGSNWSAVEEDQLVHIPDPILFLNMQEFILQDRDVREVEKLLPPTL